MLRNAILFAALTLTALPAVSQSLLIETLAGPATGGGHADGTGANARFSAPRAIAADNAGNFYVADTGNHAIRKVTSAGVVTTLAGEPGVAGFSDGTGSAAHFRFPAGIAYDPFRDVLWVSDKDNHVIRRVTLGGTVTTISGLSGVFGSADARGTDARFAFPRGLVVGNDAEIYVADTSNHVIRKVSEDGTAITFAGTMLSAATNNGTGAAARFNFPSDIALDPTTGNFYVADFGSHRIRRITPGAVVTTVAGNIAGDRDDTGSAALFNGPWGLDVDPSGNVFVADQENFKVRRVTPAGVVTTVAGPAGLSYPSGVTRGSDGAMYITEALNHVVRRVSGGSVTLIAGSLPQPGNVNGAASIARFNYPYGVAVDSAGNVYVAETTQVRRITPAGVVSTVASGYSLASGIAVGPDGNLYVADNGAGQVYRVTPAGSVTSFAAVTTPWGIAADSFGFLYVASPATHRIQMIAPNGTVSTLAGNRQGYFDGTGDDARFSFPTGVAVDAERNVYVTDWSNNVVRRITPAGVTTTYARGFTGPSGIASDAAGNLYVSDYDHVIRRVTTDGTVTIAAGLPGSPGNVNGVGTRARFAYPDGLALTPTGRLIIADPFNHAIRLGTPFTGGRRRSARH